MTRHELASFALKLLGIYAIIEALPLIQTIGGALGMLASGQGRDMVTLWTLVGMFIPLVLMAVAGMLLLAFSRGLAPLLVGEDKPLGLATALSGADVQAIGFSVVAVLILLQAIPQLTQVVVNWQYAASRSPSEPVPAYVARAIWQAAVSGGIQLVLAVVLFLRARGLSNLWRRLQAGKYVRVDEARH
jgi:hypothetical protein